MEALSRKKSTPNSQKAQVSGAAADLLDEGRKYANELYEDGLRKVDAVHQEVKGYSDDLLEQVREHPLKAVLIAGGIGLLLSALLRK